MTDNVASGSISKLKEIFENIEDIEKKPSPKKSINSFEHLKDIAPPFSQIISLYIIILDETVPQLIKWVMSFLYAIVIGAFVLFITNNIRTLIMDPTPATIEAKSIECYQCIVRHDDNFESRRTFTKTESRTYLQRLREISSSPSKSAIVAPSKQLTTNRPGPV